MAKLGPDFFVIGMQKAATRWVFDSMKSHASFKMPVVKETHHYDDRKHPIRVEGKDRVARTRARMGDKDNSNRGRRLQKFIDYLEGGRSHDDYMALFKRPDHLYSGDVTPAYSALDAAEIENIARIHPDARVVLMIRDPISRLWSAFNMFVRQEMMAAGRAPADSDFMTDMAAAMSIDELRHYLDNPGVIARSFPSRTYDKWLEVFGSDRLHLMFFADLVENPEQSWFDLERFICGAIADPGFVPPGNRKGPSVKVPMSTEAFALLHEHFLPECRDCVERFGASAERWIDAYRRQLALPG